MDTHAFQNIVLQEIKDKLGQGDTTMDEARFLARITLKLSRKYPKTMPETELKKLIADHPNLNRRLLAAIKTSEISESLSGIEKLRRIISKK